MRFSLRTLLFAMLCVSGALGGIVAGYRHGYRRGGDAYRDDYRSLREYRVKDMWRPDAPREETDLLAAEIREVVETKPARGTPARQPIEIWISSTTVSIRASETEQERAQAYFNTIRLSEGFGSGKYEAAFRKRHLYPVEDLLTRPQGGGLVLSHEELIRGMYTLMPKWSASRPPVTLTRGTLDVLGTPGDHRRIALYLKALRAMRCQPCQG
jgi:hypothetical protein